MWALTKMRGTCTPSTSISSSQLQRALRAFKGIELVEHQQLRHVVGADLVQHALHFGHLLGVVRVGGVDHVQQQVGVDRLLQRGLEGVDQAVRQVADEADGVGQRDLAGRASPR